MRRFVLSCLLLLGVAVPAGAHPLPNFRYDREIDIRLHPKDVEIRYHLMVSFWTIFADNRKLFQPEEIERMGGKLREVTKLYCEKMAPIISAKLDAQLGGKRLTFRNVKMQIEHDRDHPRLVYVFRAPWSVVSGGAMNDFQFVDRNFENEAGIVWLFLKPDRGEFKIEDAIEPEDLRGKLSTTLNAEESARFLKASATFSVPSLPQLHPNGPSLGTPTPTTAETSEPVVVEVIDQPDENFFTGVLARGPKALFDTNYGSGVLLLLAGVFGAFHAFAPGHGKSVAAAFLVGEQGTFRQAALLGLSTTFAHTGSVILIAGVFYLRYREAVPQSAQHWLGFVGGLLVLFVGMWLFMRRLRGQVDHVHLFGGCSDMCGNHNEKPKIPECRQPLRNARPLIESMPLRLVPWKSPLSWIRVVLLGIGAGAIPCVDAVLLLMLAVSAGKLAFALPLLVSFSVGLSLVLVLIGSFVVMLHRAGRNISGERGWFRFLPTASAILLMGMGLWMARDAWRGFSQIG